MVCTVGAKQTVEPSFFGRTRIPSKPTAPALGRGFLAIAGSEDILDAMDLRAFGVQPRTWLIQLVYQRRDKILITLGVMLMVAYVALSLIGFGWLWVPEAWQAFPILAPWPTLLALLARRERAATCPVGNSTACHP